MQYRPVTSSSPIERVANAEYAADQENLAMYGFTVDPSDQAWARASSALMSMHPTRFFNRIRNMSYHDLCTTLSPPAGAKYLLGLGEKFCIERGRPRGTDKLYLTNMSRLARSIRIRDALKDFEGESDYIPGLYIPSGWNPGLADVDIEFRLMAFADRIRSLTLHASKRRRNRFNLTTQQYRILRRIREDKRFIVVLTDKNLGPAIMERADYIERALKDHLLNTRVYTRLSHDDACKAIKACNSEIEELTNSYASQLSTAEQTYFERLFQQKHRVSQFYISLKVHKTPMATRPIVSTCGSLLEGVSKWLDYHLKDITPLVPTALRDSYQLLEELKTLGRLPPHARLFTCDAVSMYTNINTKHGVLTFKKWIEQHSNELPPDFPTALFLKLLELVMSENIFQFDDTFYRQEDGTAMGTSCAVQYAGNYYGYHERHELIPRFTRQLKFFKRFVDDMFGIWVGNTAEWNAFKAALPFGSLRWTTSELSHSAVFLDLTLEIVDGTVVTRTYEKSLNLFLYIPPQSAHSPGVLKSTIFGNVRRHWIQNSKNEDYCAAVQRFMGRLEARGHARKDLLPIFKEAFEKISKSQDSASTRSSSDAAPPLSTLFFHGEYHPRGVSRQNIRKAYSDILEGHCGFDRFVVACSKPQNLRGALMRAKLSEPDGLRASDFISKLLPED